MIVRSKEEMFLRLQAGEFGNHLRSWLRLSRWSKVPDSEKPETVAIRHLRPDVPPFFNLRTEKDIENALKKIDEMGRSWEECVFYEMANHDVCNFQGQYQNKDKRILEYSLTPGITLKEASSNFKLAENYAAKFILDDLLDPADAEWLETLHRRYPGHVVEFSNFRYPVGPERRCMIIWEVRDY